LSRWQAFACVCVSAGQACGDKSARKRRFGKAPAAPAQQTSKTPPDAAVRREEAASRQEPQNSKSSCQPTAGSFGTDKGQRLGLVLVNPTHKLPDDFSVQLVMTRYGYESTAESWTRLSR
jgi:hypothetical protein